MAPRSKDDELPRLDVQGDGEMLEQLSTLRLQNPADRVLAHLSHFAQGREPRGAGNVYLRGSTYWIHYSFRGRLVRESSGSTKRTDATKLLRRRLAEMGTGQLVGPDWERTSIDDLTTLVVNDYQLNGRRSTKTACEALARLGAFFTFARVPDLTGARIAAYVRHRQEAGAAPATIKYDLAILKRAFKLAVASGMAAVVPSFPVIAVDNARQGILSRRATSRP